MKAYRRARGVAFGIADLPMDREAAQDLKLRNIRTAPVLEVDGELLAGSALETERIDARLAL